MKKLISAGILVLVLATSTTLSIAPLDVRPIPSHLFKPVQTSPITSVIEEPILNTPVPRQTPKLKKPKIIIKVDPTKPPAESDNKPKVYGSSTSGIASWYCKTGISRCTVGYPGGYYAAIRKDLLELREKRVLVCAGKGNCIKVTIIDCNCGVNANLIDLYWDAFNALGDPSMGRMEVTLSW